MLINFFTFLKKPVNGWLHSVYTSLKDLIGRTDLLEVLPGETAKHAHLDLSKLLESHPAAEGKQQYCQVQGNAPFDKGILAEKMVDEDSTCD